MWKKFDKIMKSGRLTKVIKTTGLNDGNIHTHKRRRSSDSRSTSDGSVHIHHHKTDNGKSSR